MVTCLTDNVRVHRVRTKGIDFMSDENEHSVCNPLLSADDVRWVVNDGGELGVEINGQYFFCYKGESISYDDEPTHDDGSPIMVRQIGKREFGETVWPVSWMVSGRRDHRYAVEVEYHAGLSDGTPDDPRWQWKPLGG